MPDTRINTMKLIDMVAATLVFLGGINWGLVGAFDFNLVEYVLGGLPILSRAFYLLVGIAAVYDFALWEAIQHRWGCTGFFGETRASET
ncbi:MAG: DUF378 domain-containing protein [Syntrophobacteraceae bacterium]